MSHCIFLQPSRQNLTGGLSDMQDPQVSKANTSRADLGVSDRPFQCLTNLNLYGKNGGVQPSNLRKKHEIVAYAEESLGVHLISHNPRTDPLGLKA